MSRNKRFNLKTHEATETLIDLPLCILEGDVDQVVNGLLNARATARKSNQGFHKFYFELQGGESLNLCGTRFMTEEEIKAEEQHQEEMNDPVKRRKNAAIKNL